MGGPCPSRGCRVVSQPDLLLAVLNSTPVVADAQTDSLVGGVGRGRLRAMGGKGGLAELTLVREVRDALQIVVRGSGDVDTATASLQAVMRVATHAPVVVSGGVEWVLHTPPDSRLPVEVVLAWSQVNRLLPGRLRPCANPDCRLFLIDRSRPGTARWCSMAVCGNRMKVRAHARRQRT